ncbi:MAG: aldose 1-epimerase family protein [Streptosporangiaceae bacterium]
MTPHPPSQAPQALAASTGSQEASVPVTGAQYELSAGDYRAVITELGAGLRELSQGGTPVVFGYEPDELPPGAAGQLLTPWPNRVDHGRYHFGGADFQLDLSEVGNGNAIHGLTRLAAWVPVRHEPASVVLRHLPHGYAGYPFCLETDAEYRLTPDAGLHVTISATNRGTRPAPYGFGQHPYLTVGASALDEWELALPATRWLAVDQRGIPSGPAEDIDGAVCDFRSPRAIGSSHLDHALTGLTRESDGRAWAHLRSAAAQVSLWAGPNCPWLQVFTSDTLHGDRHHKAVAIEPMSCPPNAFVTGDSLIVLAPGETVTHHWGVQAHQA